MIRTSAIFLLFLGAALAACAKTSSKTQGAGKDGSLDGLAVATFASGCFWCVEAIYESVNGVHEAVSGYSGGESKDPSYRNKGGHAESVQVYYDPKVVSFADLIEVYFNSQDPTQVNGQGNDRGAAYRSIIFYRTPEEKQIAEKAKADLAASGKYDRPIAAEIQPFVHFKEAEDYHQDFERNNPDNPYVQNVSIPRLERFKQQCPALIKK
ncbi:MAG: peptide-methionine (S)-S-oxide reductase MsrA [Opitutaceae bacterium]